MITQNIKLTQFSPGAGCGCKISPEDLGGIIQQIPDKSAFEHLLVGCESRDDAAVYDLGNGMAMISTTDFFTPIVDDPYDFGCIAATNAISDVYAMGGKPLVAISILGWPVSKLPAELAARVIEGAVDSCREAGIPLAGGHSIDISDPVFGLAVTGIMPTSQVKRNNTAKAGCRLFITKPLGIGILSTAGKKGILDDQDYRSSVAWMTKLNSAGMELGKMDSVQAMTDVTGFGLLGHLLEICEGSHVSARIRFSSIPKVENLAIYISKNCIPGGTYRNWKSYGEKISDLTEYQKVILADPQTSGGLLIAVDKNAPDFDAFARKNSFVEIGQLEENGQCTMITVEE
jgi:selenide, water dikinase